MPQLSKAAIDKLANEWLGAKLAKEMITEREELLNARLKLVMDTYGVEDPNDGHIYYEVQTPEGPKTIRKQKSISTFMDPDLAAELLTIHEKLAEFSAWQVTVLDHDKAGEALEMAGLTDPDKTGLALANVPTEESVREAYYAKVLDDTEYRAIFSDTVSWSLIRVKSK